MKTIPFKFESGTLFVLDQILLPNIVEWIPVKSSERAYGVIKNMNVRGAPLIGFTGVFGLMFACLESSSYQELEIKADFLISARPTAVNLSFEINSCVSELKNKFSDFNSVSASDFCLNFVQRKISDLEKDNQKTANFLKEKLIEIYPEKEKFNILTICNTGRLACGTTGTALGAISTLNDHQMINKVFACETRPYLQGSRLTAFELEQENIDHNIVPDGATAHVLKTQNIDAVFVGADRIALNGDTANKIGTCNLGIISNFYKVPFFVVAPLSSFDFECESGDCIEIEMREGSELTIINKQYIAPKNSKGFNPAFDVTSSNLITGIACEKGVWAPGDIKALAKS